LLSQSVDLVSGDEHQLAILDSGGDGMSCGYRDGLDALSATVDDSSDELITTSNGVPVMSTKSIRDVSRMTSASQTQLGR
jgi:hypothetical protein